MENIIASYNEAEYFIDDVNRPVKIGETHAEVDALLKEYGASSWCFITAWNPISVELSAEENIARNENLKKDLTPYRVFEGEGRDPNGEWMPERSFFVLGISRMAAAGLAFKFGQRAILYGEPDKPAELAEILFTRGNCEIIRRNKIAFLCGREIPAGTRSSSSVSKYLDWAVRQREAGNCVIGGFHSQIEKEVMHCLLQGEQPVIIVPARGLAKYIEPALKQALANDRLLIITPFDQNVKRAGKSTELTRNKLMIELADRIAAGRAGSEEMIGKLILQTNKRIEYI